jgi:hypothetical protein
MRTVCYYCSLPGVRAYKIKRYDTKNRSQCVYHRNNLINRVKIMIDEVQASCASRHLVEMNNDWRVADMFYGTFLN